MLFILSSFHINVGLCLISLFSVSFRSLSFFFRAKTKQNKTDLRRPHTLSMATTTTATPADINARDKRGRTKIYHAADAGDAAEVARLLELKADFELLTFDKRKYLSLFNDKKKLFH